MDAAYDHITEDAFSSDRAPTPTPSKPEAPSTSTPATRPNLNAEFQETFQAFSNSPWGAKLSGLWGNVVKQSEQYYEGARREVGEASEEARKGFSDLKESIVNQPSSWSLDEEGKGESQRRTVVDDSTLSNTDHEEAVTQSDKKRTESKAAHENEGLISRFRSETAKRLKNIEKAEDTADEALLRFGTNIRNFLRDVVAVAPSAEGENQENKNRSDVLFESKDSTGKRMIHPTRFDAQLHVIHSTFDSFTKDPISTEWPSFEAGFHIEDKTNQISRDLERHPDLRRAMEQLVPDKVDPLQFWCRYYFLRLVIETEEQKRRELLQGASNRSADEEVTWDADSDSDSEPEADNHQNAPKTTSSSSIAKNTARDTSSTTTLTSQTQPQLSHPQEPPTVSITTPTTNSSTSNDSNQAAVSADHRTSHPDDSSDASYDLVSRANSRTTGSPKEEDEEHRKLGAGPGSAVGKTRADESDEEDWE